MSNHATPIIKRMGGLVGVVFLVLLPLIIDNPYWVSVFIMTGIFVLMASSMRTILLFGQLSLGHIGFMLVGAYASALLATRWSWPFPLALLGAGALSGLLALGLGFPFLRVRGIYFSILTLLTAESLRLLAYNWTGLTGGALGLFGIPSAGTIEIPSLIRIDFENPTHFYYLMLAVVSLSLLFLWRLERSRLGFKWRAIREAEKVARSVGVDVIRYKITCFAVACFFAGIAGGLFTYFQRGVGAGGSSIFSAMTSIYFLVYIVIGGEKYFAGPILGAIVMSLVAEFSRPLAEYQQMLIGGLAVFFAVLLPGGIIDLARKLGGLRQ